MGTERAAVPVCAVGPTAAAYATQPICPGVDPGVGPGRIQGWVQRWVQGYIQGWTQRVDPEVDQFLGRILRLIQGSGLWPQGLKLPWKAGVNRESSGQAGQFP